MAYIVTLISFEGFRQGAKLNYTLVFWFPIKE
jgi:hypothetical protein